MSNHSGSYMLNDVLFLLERENVFKTLGPDTTRRIAAEIVKLSDEYDCNAGEILDEIGPRIGLCYYCLKPATEFADWGGCTSCDQEL
jgi:hypothetical protein